MQTTLKKEKQTNDLLVRLPDTVGNLEVREIQNVIDQSDLKQKQEMLH